MPSKSDYLENAIIDAILGGGTWSKPATVYLALFTVAPSDAGGGTEVTGGSYARKSVTNNASEFPNASGGVKQNANAQAFVTATADWGTVLAWGIFDAPSTGNLLYWGEFTGALKPFTADATTDVITCVGHGFSDTNEVRVNGIPGGTLPTGISAGTTYFVRDASTNTFKVAATSGGSAIDLTTAGAGFVAKLTSKTVGNGDTLTIPASGLTITEY